MMIFHFKKMSFVLKNMNFVPGVKFITLLKDALYIMLREELDVPLKTRHINHPCFTIFHQFHQFSFV